MEDVTLVVIMKNEFQRVRASDDPNVTEGILKFLEYLRLMQSYAMDFLREDPKCFEFFRNLIKEFDRRQKHLEVATELTDLLAETISASSIVERERLFDLACVMINENRTTIIERPQAEHEIFTVFSLLKNHIEAQLARDGNANGILKLALILPNINFESIDKLIE